jgi:hypothetical protein
MFRKGTCCPDASAIDGSVNGAFLLCIFVRVAVVLMIGIAVLAPPRILAQHGGGGGGRGGMAGGTGVGVGAGRPDGVSDKDDLKDFHRAMALQATADQRAAFGKIAQYVQAASDQLQVFRESLKKGSASSPLSSSLSSPLSERAAAVDDAIARARAGNQNFSNSFSPAQKSGLKDLTNKLSKTDTELDKQIKVLDQAVQSAKAESAQIADAATTLDKELASFQSEQLAIGREMGILLSPDSQDLSFSLPKATNPVSVGGQLFAIPTSGIVSRTSAENGHNVFSVKLVADLSNLQQNVTGILRSEITRLPRCGERIEIQQATLTPLPPASQVLAHLHFERWVCPPGQGSPMEMAAGDATVEVKLTPIVTKDSGLSLAAEITHVNAEGFLRDLLRSGDLGATLREQIATLMLAAVKKTADLKAALPAVAQESATLQKAQFEDGGADQLNLALDGELQFSDEQVTRFAAQLKQRLSAQGAPAP